MGPSHSNDIILKAGDALVAVDIQNDFFAQGSLPVPQAEEVVPIINRYIELFHAKALPIFTTRDWHPPKHSSFKEQGGPWPVHCVAGTKGAEFHKDFKLPSSGVIISAATTVAKDAYSGFEGTGLDEQMKSLGIGRLFIGGLATDYCVLNTVKDAIKHGYAVFLLEDATRAVNVKPGDGENAVEEMVRLGAVPIEFDNIS
jgi:nicotinamidase/pyrazinamidase